MEKKLSWAATCNLRQKLLESRFRFQRHSKVSCALSADTYNVCFSFISCVLCFLLQIADGPKPKWSPVHSYLKRCVTYCMNHLWRLWLLYLPRDCTIHHVTVPSTTWLHHPPRESTIHHVPASSTEHNLVSVNLLYCFVIRHSKNYGRTRFVHPNSSTRQCSADLLNTIDLAQYMWHVTKKTMQLGNPLSAPHHGLHTLMIVYCSFL